MKHAIVQKPLIWGCSHAITEQSGEQDCWETLGSFSGPLASVSPGMLGIALICSFCRAFFPYVLLRTSQSDNFKLLSGKLLERKQANIKRCDCI